MSPDLGSMSTTGCPVEGRHHPPNTTKRHDKGQTTQNQPEAVPTRPSQPISLSSSSRVVLHVRSRISDRPRRSCRAGIVGQQERQRLPGQHRLIRSRNLMRKRFHVRRMAGDHRIEHAQGTPSLETVLTSKRNMHFWGGGYSSVAVVQQRSWHSLVGTRTSGPVGFAWAKLGVPIVHSHCALLGATLGAMRAVRSEPTYQEAGKNIWWHEYFFESRGRR